MASLATVVGTEEGETGDSRVGEARAVEAREVAMEVRVVEARAEAKTVEARGEAATVAGSLRNKNRMSASKQGRSAGSQKKLGSI